MICKNILMFCLLHQLQYLNRGPGKCQMLSIDLVIITYLEFKIQNNLCIANNEIIELNLHVIISNKNLNTFMTK